MRTILFSSERVSANSWEAGAFIAFLLIFAVAAAWHVLQEGLKVRRKTARPDSATEHAGRLHPSTAFQACLAACMRLPVLAVGAVLLPRIGMLES